MYRKLTSDGEVSDLRRTIATHAELIAMLSSGLFDRRTGYLATEPVPLDSVARCDLLIGLASLLVKYHRGHFRAPI